MRRTEALLAAVQLADSALPIGRFVHSHGLEAWLRDHADATESDLAELVEAVVCEGVAPLDGVVAAYAHRSRTVEELARLDQLLTTRKLTPSSRLASAACGRKLAAIAPRLAPGDILITGLAGIVERRETDGNLAVVSGTLARAKGVTTLDASALELRGSAASLLSAAVRLGSLSPTGAQTILARLTPVLAAAAEAAASLSLDEMRSTTPELELYALMHARAEGRLFST